MNLDDILRDIDKNLDDMTKSAGGFLNIHAKKMALEGVKKFKKPSVFITVHSLYGVKVISKIDNQSAHDHMLHEKCHQDILAASAPLSENLLALKNHIASFPIFSNQAAPHICMALINKGASGYRRKIDFQVFQQPSLLGTVFKSYLPYEHDGVKAILDAAKSLEDGQASLEDASGKMSYTITMETPQINAMTIHADSAWSALAFCAITKCARLACPQSHYAMRLEKQCLKEMSKKMFKIS